LPRRANSKAYDDGPERFDHETREGYNSMMTDIRYAVLDALRLRGELGHVS
jgi:hypothetical protein